MTEALALYQPAAAIAPQANTDTRLVELWLHGRPATTSSAYATEVQRFLAFVGKPLRTVTLGVVY